MIYGYMNFEGIWYAPASWDAPNVIIVNGRPYAPCPEFVGLVQTNAISAEALRIPPLGCLPA